MRKEFSFFLCLALTQTVYSQTDSLILDANENSATITSHDAIFNGREHINYLPSIEGVPYYQSSDWQKGTLRFRDGFYPNLFLKYDLVTDEVVIRHNNGFTGIILFTPRIQAFSLGNSRFVYLSGGNAGIPDGVYEELRTGNISLYAKRSKLIKETVLSTGIEKKIVDRDMYYVLKNGQYYAINKQKTILDLIKEKKNEINTYLKQEGVKYKNNPEAALIKIVDFYNQTSR